MLLLCTCAQISGGAGEVLISRDVWRLSARLDFFRLLHFFHSGEQVVA